MKRSLLVLAMLLLSCVVSFGQNRFEMYRTQNIHNQLQLDTSTGKIMQIQDDGQSWVICSKIEESTTNRGRFCLYETKNIWTFILLDTYDGRLWQAQYSVQGEEYMVTVPINEVPVLTNNKKSVFSIQPLTSMFQYYLVNDETGDMWKFQWSTKGEDYRWIEKFR